MSSTAYNLQRQTEIPHFNTKLLKNKNDTTVYNFQRQIEIPHSSTKLLKNKNDATVFNLSPDKETAHKDPSKDSLDRQFGDLAFPSSSAYEKSIIKRAKIQLLIYEDMKQVFKENKQDNWDGYKAIGINDDQFRFAKKFINKLFESDLNKDILKKVDINPENYGNIAFDWFVEHDHQISISIRDNKVVFTYRFDEKKLYGEISVDGKLDFIIDLIKSLYE